MKTLPTDPTKLYELLQGIKDKQAKLEADLAIQEHPDLEGGITTVALALHKLKTVSRKVKVFERASSGTVSSRILFLERTIEHYKKKIQVAQDELTQIGKVSEIDSKFSSLVEEKKTANKVLVDSLGEWSEAFTNRGIDILKLIPSLQDFV